MTTEESKTRSKRNFTQDEIMSLVDLIHDNKSKLFGSITSTLTIEDKNKISEEIAGRLFELHGNVRARDDIMKNGTTLYQNITLITLIRKHLRKNWRRTFRREFRSKFFKQAPRKRHHWENDELESAKRAILDREDKKLNIFDRLCNFANYNGGSIKNTSFLMEYPISSNFLETSPVISYF